jgi:hypothetical protein
MRIEILEEAENDLIDGFTFYDRQSKGLGDYFPDSVFADIESLYLHAGIYALHYGYHRILAKRFPCEIYYQIYTYGIEPDGSTRAAYSHPPPRAL